MARFRISNAFTRAMLDGHGLIGVIFGAVIYILCLSGSLIVLVDQLTIWERPQAPIVRDVTPDMLQRVSEDAYVRAKAAGVAHDLFINAPTPELPLLNIYAYGEGGEAGNHREWSADAAGRLGPGTDVPWVEFVQTLHFNLTVPGALGRYVVGIFGTLLLASLFTGILAHRRILKDAFRLRWGGSRRLTNADLHNRIGVWALPFHLIVSLTGSLLGLSGLIIFGLAMVAFKGDQTRAIASLLGPQATEDSRPAPVPDIRPMLVTINAETPGARVSQLRIEHVGTAGQQVTVSVAAPGHLTRAESYIFSPDGTLKQKAGFTDGNVGMRIYGMLTPLHYGTYGGLPLKVIYALLGGGLTLIAATGGNVWLARRRDQGRAAPRLERLWAGILWGQPLALALAAVGEVTGVATALPVYWSAVLLVWVVVLAVPSAGRSAALLRIATAVTLLALAGLHMARWGLPGAISVAVDMLWVVMALAMIWADRSALSPRTARTPDAAPSVPQV
ncbi:PepSY-associated TM helix domain-containing protein [Novosphingobium gossypii]|uniref:PepSY-associated TM helix domain-containing protein n=1 Tax=Novosphingobium gossypii TaxID=1604774 RepID=UPI003D232D8F